MMVFGSPMPPDLYFALTLILKMAITAGFVLTATVTAERAGPLVGGLVATLPISAGPVYIFLAIDHNAQFIAQSALGSLVTNAINILFALVYVLLAQKRSLAVGLGGAFATWTALIWAVGFVHWTLPLAIAFNIITLAVSMWLSAPLRHVAAPRIRARWTDLALRAAMVAVLVGTVVGLSFHIGPRMSGNLAVFPIVLTSIIIILHPRVGGPATAAVMANAITGLGGFAAAATTLLLIAEPLGSALALAVTLMVSVGCNIVLFLARRRQVTA